MVGADVEPADVVAHDDENVGRPLLRLLLRLLLLLLRLRLWQRHSLLLLRGRRCARQRRDNGACEQTKPSALTDLHDPALHFRSCSADDYQPPRSSAPLTQATSVQRWSHFISPVRYRLSGLSLKSA